MIDKKLELSGKNTSFSQAVETLSSLNEHLEVLSIIHFNANNEIKKLISLLINKHFPILTSLKLSYNNLNIIHVDFIRALVKALPKLKKLDLSSNNFSEQDTQKIAYGITLLYRKTHRYIELILGEQLFSSNKNNFKAEKHLVRSSSAECLQSKNYTAFWSGDNNKKTYKEDNKLMKFLPNHQQQTDYTCGVAVMRNIIDYYKITNAVACKNLLLPTEETLAKAINSNEETGTDTSNMTQWFKDNNYEIAQGVSGNINILHECVTNNIPVIVNNNKAGGHYVVVKAVKARNNNLDDAYIIFSDPGSRFNGYVSEKTKNAEDFLGEWKDSEGIEGIYLIAIPKTLLENNVNLNSWWQTFKMMHDQGLGSIQFDENQPPLLSLN